MEIIYAEGPNNMRAPGTSRDGLIDMYSYIGRGIGVELGCNTGNSTEIAVQMNEHVHCIDCWLAKSIHDGKPIEEWFDMRMKNHSNFTKYKMYGYEAVSKFTDRSLDFVYIDAQHDYNSVCNDIDMWLPKVKIGGYICGHDYNTTIHLDVIRAVTDKLKCPEKVFKDTSWIKKV